MGYVWSMAGAGALALIYFTRRLAGRSVAVAAAFYAATLSPLLGFIMLYTFRYTYVADHYQYVASLGPIALAACVLTLALARLEKHARWLAPAVGAGLLALLGCWTWRQYQMYRDLETLLANHPGPKPNLVHGVQQPRGGLLGSEDRVDDALALFQRAVDLEPGDANAHFNLARALLRKQKLGESAAQYRKVLENLTEDPKTETDLGAVLVEMDRSRRKASLISARY